VQLRVVRDAECPHVDQPPDPGLAHRVDDGSRAVRVGPTQIGAPVVVPRDGGQVDHRVDAIHRLAKGGGLGDVACTELDLSTIGQPEPLEHDLAGALASDERDDPVPRVQQGGHEVSADEPAGPGDEDRGHGGQGSIERMPEPLSGQPLKRLIEAMPKAELHLHLDGSLRVDTALDLARTRAIDAPRDWAGMSAALIAPMPCADQAELLRAFDLPIALMQDAEALERITAELVETKATDNVRYVEIRWGPLLHVAGGLSLADGLAAVCAGARAASARTGTVVRLICTAIRSHDPAANLELARTAVQFRDQGLTGWDLAGPEASFPDPLTHAAAYDVARAGGLRITVHAGEWGGATQVRRALTVSPERIAHGPSAIDDPELCRALIDRGVTLDVCPTSNWQAGIVPSVSAHPLARLHRAGVSVTLNTDDTTVSDITLSEDYVNGVEQIGLTLPELWAIDRRALDVAFAEDEALAPLRAEFDAWASGIPELAATASLIAPPATFRP
jgi:adenosine deaminase